MNEQAQTQTDRHFLTFRPALICPTQLLLLAVQLITTLRQLGEEFSHTLLLLSLGS